ncbi:MAG TPA: GNAT family N-acetyltransferase [Arachnia sp.]|nr:GNAT family N-acetyltransferase [Arachnia sp.]HMT87379.1 GNAT family N-acetyltransferase [Arachnia sp.]
MAGRLRTLGGGDRAAALDFLERSPVENLFLTAKIGQFGVDRRRLGFIHAFERDGEITALLLDGGTIFATGTDPEAIPAFVERLGARRRATSILGPSFAALGVFVGLEQRYPSAWGRTSNVRRRQPLMVLDAPPAVDADPRVARLDLPDLQSYLEASVHMYTEEIGSSPYKYGPGYDTFAAQRVENGDAYGIVEDGVVIFKADLGPKHRGQVQLQGVWVHPEHRGTGLAVPALSGMLRLVMRQFPVVSLYVNDFNTPAIRSYARLGFVEVGALSTVHY